MLSVASPLLGQARAPAAAPSPRVAERRRGQEGRRGELSPKAGRERQSLRVSAEQGREHGAPMGRQEAHCQRRSLFLASSVGSLLWQSLEKGSAQSETLTQAGSESLPSRKIPASQALDLTDWPLVTGNGFALKVPPGFLDVMPPPEEDMQSTVMQNKAPKTPFVAEYASPDGNEVVSVLSQPATKVKLTFIQVDDISAFGSLDEAAAIFISSGARVLAKREFSAAWFNRRPRTYYLYEYVSAGRRVAMCLAAAQGTVFVVGASAPEEKWRPAAARLRATAGAFLLTS